MRGALCAPVLHGLTDAEGLHYWEGLAGSWLPEGGWPGKGPTSLCGRAEPPPPGGASLAKRPREVNPGTTRRVVFSEGRTLCVRMARLNECRGIPFSPDDEARGLWPTGDMSGPGRCLPCGRAEPAPPRGGRSEVRRPSGGRPENRRRAFFSEGRGLRVRIVRPDEWQAMGLPPVLLR